MKKIWTGLGLALLLLSLNYTELSAQNRLKRQRPNAFPNREERAERFDMLMKMKLVEVLDLTPEQGDRFLPSFNQYRQKTQRLLRARAEVMQGLARHVRTQMDNLAPKEEPLELSERELKERLSKLAELHQEQEAVRQEFHQKAGEVLSIGQVARLIVFEEMFAREILRNLPKP